MTPKILENVLKINPYQAGEREIEGVDRIIKLSSNENTLGPSPKAIEAYKAAADNMQLYPDPSSTDLRHALADHWGLEADRIITGTGSDDLLGLICEAYAADGDEVLFPALTFPMYQIAAHGVNATPVHAAMDGDAVSIDNLLAASTEKTKIVYLANPNNPTGHYLPRSEVQRLREGLPRECLLVLDSAYAEYVNDPDYSAGEDIVKASIASGHDNVIMTRTFSKMYALAGLRVGWAYGPDEVIGAIGRIRAPFAVSVPAEAAALAALGDKASFDRSLAHNNKWLPIVNAKLEDLGYDVVKGAGNFAYFRVPINFGTWTELDAHLKSCGVIIRAVPPAEALRATIGTAEENEAFLEALESFER